MNAAKIFALALIAAGVLGLVYGGFTYTKDTHEANVGPLSLSIKDKETVNIPIWAGVVAVVIGGGLLVFASRKS
jgi:TRAP-type C4-dicarboxylate transport system permease small subunit